MKRTLLLLFLSFIFANAFSQSRVLQSLKENDKVQRGYYLYPSTLRMLNFQDDEEFNKMIRDVRKVAFLNMKTANFGKDQVRETINKLQKEEGFEVYLELSEANSELLVMGREKPNELIGVSSQEGKCYIIDLIGSIDLLQVPKIYEKFTQRDSAQVDGIGMLFNMINEDAEREKRWEERRKKREEERRQRDSIEQSEAILEKDSVMTEEAP